MPGKPRPKKRGAKKRGGVESRVVGISVMLPAKLADALDALAAEKGWSRSEAVTRAVRQLIESASG